MVKGWRLNPALVERWERKRKDRAERKAALWRAEWRMHDIERQAEMALALAKLPRSVIP